MPKDTSSSSEDEAENPIASESTENNTKTSKYECPQDFVSFRHVPCGSTLSDNLRNGENELWLIKAPNSFNPKSFRGVKVPLSGLQTLKVPCAAGPGEDQQVYSVLASSRCSSELRLITSARRASGGAAFGPEFSGLLNVCESYGDGSANRVPRVIPATPAPSIPPGLKQRFHPFGSKTPTLTYVAENEADGAAFGPSSTTLRPLVVKRFLDETVHEVEEEEEDARKKKKKKKKEKRMKSEQMEEIIRVKQEPEDPFEEGEQPLEKIRKKKKKKDREREEVEEGLEPSVTVKEEEEEEVPVKCEPMVGCYGDATEFPGKKKKKKKKSRTDCLV